MPISKVISLPEKASSSFSSGVRNLPAAAMVATEKRLKHQKLHRDFGKVAFVLLGRTGCAPHNVAEIIEREAGHHGIEVDHAKSLAGGLVEDDIVQLGVVVRDALGQLRIEQEAGHRLMGEGEFDLGLAKFRPSRRIGPDGLEQRLEAFRSVVIIGNRACSRGAGKSARSP